MYYNTLNSFNTLRLRKPPSYKIYFTHYHRIVGHVSFDQSTVFAWSSKLQREIERIGDKKLSSLQHFWYSLNLKTIFHFWRLKLKLLHFYIDFNVEALSIYRGNDSLSICHSFYIAQFLTGFWGIETPSTL